MRSAHKAPVSAPIVVYQRVAKAGWSNSRFTHVAIFDGHDLWDAVPFQGVRRVTLGHAAAEGRWLQAMRLHAGKIDTRRLQDAIVALAGVPYSMGNFADLLAFRVTGRRRGQVPDVTAAVICSVFVHRVLSASTPAAFLTDVPISVPSDYLDERYFDKIPLNWNRCDEDVSVLG